MKQVIKYICTWSLFGFSFQALYVPAAQAAETPAEKETKRKIRARLPSPQMDITPTPAEQITVVGRATPPPEITDHHYQSTPDASTLRTTKSILNIPQVVNIVSAQVIQDQAPRNLDDVLTNVSGITQGNTLAGTQDTIMKRGFGGNRDGSIMHNGMPLVQGRGGVINIISRLR